jgi:hypothetical protein
MNNTSQYISSFFFITEAKQKPNVFNLIFEGGKIDLGFSNILQETISILNAVISALEFLESIQLFHPKIGIENVIQVRDGSYKLVNQFCFSDFLGFITDVYLSNNLSSAELNRILMSKRAQNLGELRGMVSRIIITNPQIRQNWHSISNLTVFENFLNEALNRGISFKQIKSKFEELFDVLGNCNRGFGQAKKMVYSSSKKTYPVVNKSPGQINRGIGRCL